MTRQEIEEAAQKKFDAITPDEMAAFFAALDNEPSEREPAPPMRPEDIVRGALAPDDPDYEAASSPIVGADALRQRIHLLARKIVAQLPGEDVEDMARQLMSVTEGKDYKAVVQKIDNAVAEVACKYDALPDPFAIAQQGIVAAREEADQNYFSRDPIPALALMGELLKIDAYINLDNVEFRLRSGKTEKMNIQLFAPAACQKGVLVNALNAFMLASAALAKVIGSSAVERWKLAIDFVWRKSRIGKSGGFVANGLARGWTQAEVDELLRLIDAARAEAHVDYVIFDYERKRKGVRA